MQIEFKTTIEDYHKIQKLYFFRRNLPIRLLLILLIAVWFGFFNQVEKPFRYSVFILQAFVAAAIFIALFILRPYLVAIIKLKRHIKSNSLELSKTMVIEEKGLKITSAVENSFWRWEVLNKAEFLGN